MNKLTRQSSLKRKASTDLLADHVHSIEYDGTQSPPKTHVQQHASPKEISSLYEKTYLDTVIEIKRLLQHYAFVLAADANPDLNPDGPLEGDASAVHAFTSTTVDAVADAKTELKAILDDLASKPELLSMEKLR